MPQASRTGLSAGSWELLPEVGSKVSWSMTAWRTMFRAVVSVVTARIAEEDPAEDLLGERFPVSSGGPASRSSGCAPGARSWRVTYELPRTTAGFSSISVDWLVIVP